MVEEEWIKGVLVELTMLLEIHTMKLIIIY
jgi:hypothetical protein